MATIHPFRRLNACLDSLRSVVVWETKKSRALSGLGQTIADTEEEYKELADSIDDPEVLSDDYHTDIEQLLGACYVVCQQKMNSVCGKAYRIDKELGKEDEYKNSRKANLKLGNHSVSNEFSDVEIIDILANLFKHYDEWPSHDLKEMSPGMRRMVNALKQVGIAEVEPFPTKDGNHIEYAYISSYALIEASERMGNQELKHPLVFHDLVTNWAEDVLRKYEQLADHHTANIT
jgi:hypothetical protein